MANTRELSQLASLININDETKSIRVLVDQPDAKLGIGTENPIAKVDVSGDVNVSGVITATSFYGDASNLTGISSFSGDYNDLINKPTIPSIVGLASEGYVDNSLVGFITSGALDGYATETFVNNSLVGYATEGYVNNLVAISTFSGNYDDLNNKPLIPSDTSDLTNNTGFVTSGIVVGYATEGYVNTAVANLVDSAPEALDTLNELAAALGDDANFSTTITNSLASKANLSGANFTGVVTATSFYGDGSNLSNIISGVGIQSAGVVVGTGITTLNFIGVGNTFSLNGNTVNISIAGGGGVSISTEAPSNPNEGDLWYSPIYGRTFIYYEDEDSLQWVDAAPFNLGIIDSLDSLTLDSLIVENNANISGVVTASAFFGDGSNLTGVSAGSTVADDTSTDETFYPLLTQQTSGTVTASKISTTKLSFNPSSGTLNAVELNATSDENLKENIKPIEDSLSKVLQLNGVEFDWKESKQSSLGVIAQEIEKVFPNLVKTAENKSVNYNGLIGVLIEAIKEQQKQIEELRNLLNN